MRWLGNWTLGGLGTRAVSPFVVQPKAAQRITAHWAHHFGTDGARHGLGGKPAKALSPSRRSLSAVSRQKPSSGPPAPRPLRSTAVTRPPAHTMPCQAVVSGPLQTSPVQVARPSHGVWEQTAQFSNIVSG